MKLDIQPSTVAEDSMSMDIYMSERLRTDLKFEVGKLLPITTNSGNIIFLEIRPAHRSDVERSEISAFVSKRIYSMMSGGQLASKEVEKIPDMTLGCDPELFLVNRATNSVVDAGIFFRRNGPIGYDGEQLEFRPMYDTDPAVVTHNIHKLIIQARQILNMAPLGRQTRMVAASSWREGYKRLTAGFHLHFGIPHQILHKGRAAYSIAKVFAKVLDYYVGFPCAIAEGSEDSFRRAEPYIRYGKPGCDEDQRVDHRTFEYRFPGGYMLRHPIYACGLIALGAVVTEDIVSRVREKTDDYATITRIVIRKDVEDLYPSLPSPSEICNELCTIDVSLAKGRLEQILTDVRNMVGYTSRAQHIEPFFRVLFEGTKFSNDVEENWGGIESHA
jgi:hypothetical protein